MGKGAGVLGGWVGPWHRGVVGKWQAMQRRRVCLIHGWMDGWVEGWLGREVLVQRGTRIGRELVGRV
jgi:hypothetical protein